MKETRGNISPDLIKPLAKLMHIYSFHFSGFLEAYFVFLNVTCKTRTYASAYSPVQTGLVLLVIKPLLHRNIVFVCVKHIDELLMLNSIQISMAIHFKPMQSEETKMSTTGVTEQERAKKASSHVQLQGIY